jgi:hypothetical protein
MMLMHDGLFYTTGRLLRWWEFAMTDLWWWGCGWECLAWMHDWLLAAIGRLLRWQELAMTDLWYAFLLIWMQTGSVSARICLWRFEYIRILDERLSAVS